MILKAPHVHATQELCVYFSLEMWRGRRSSLGPAQGPWKLLVVLILSRAI